MLSNHFMFSSNFGFCHFQFSFPFRFSCFVSVFGYCCHWFFTETWFVFPRHDYVNEYQKQTCLCWWRESAWKRRKRSFDAASASCCQLTRTYAKYASRPIATTVSRRWWSCTSTSAVHIAGIICYRYDCCYRKWISKKILLNRLQYFDDILRP